MAPPLKFIKQKGSVFKIHQPKRSLPLDLSTIKGSHHPKTGYASRDNFYGSRGIHFKRILLNSSPLTFSGKFSLLDSDRLAASIDPQRYVVDEFR